jgi:hypothetical protein
MQQGLCRYGCARQNHIGGVNGVSDAGGTPLTRSDD